MDALVKAERFDVVWPRGRRQMGVRPLAPRLATLSGKKVAELWTFMFRGDEVFELLEAELVERYPGVEFISWREFENVHGANEGQLVAELPDLLRKLEIDAVIVGMACCGSCAPAVVRAAAACERAGVPAVSITCEGYVRQAATTATGLGMPNMPWGIVPGNIELQTPEELRGNIIGVTLGTIIDGLTAEPAEGASAEEIAPDQIIFSGSFDEVNEHFHDNEWTGGLPIVPPTIDRVEQFLRFTDRARDEVLGVLAPDNRAVTIWNVAVNGVMAGCKPQYMPVLVAIAEALADPEYGVEHSGNAPGSETVILLNGPIIKQLDFNYEQGVMRDGVRANTSVGRFFRLCLRNIAGYLHHQTDMAVFGGTWRVVIAENEDVAREIGWAPNSVDMGYEAGANIVTIGRYVDGNLIVGVAGQTPAEMLRYVVDVILRQTSWEVIFTVGMSLGKLRPLVLLSPLIARRLAVFGLSKDDVKQHLFDHCRIPARTFDRYLNFGNPVTEGPWNLRDLVRKRQAPKYFAESDDPERLVPIVVDPDDYMIVISGEPAETIAYSFVPNGIIGYQVAKEIQLPEDWPALVKA
jgi:hypothetical protein